MRKILAAFLIVGFMAVVSNAATVHYSFDEVASGTWEVSVSASGDTAGLSAYGFYVYQDPATVSYAESTLTTLGATYAPIGFMSSVAGDVGGVFNAGNYQSAGASAITGIGLEPVLVNPPVGVPVASVDLDVPAVLGTLTTVAGLGADDFAPDGAGLLNVANDGYLSGVIVTHSVNPMVPEPMTMTVLAVGLVGIIRKRK